MPQNPVTNANIEKRIYKKMTKYSLQEHEVWRIGSHINQM